MGLGSRRFNRVYEGLNKMDYLLEGEQTDRLRFRRVSPSDYKDWLPFHKEPMSSRYWEGLSTNAETACQQQFDRIFERYSTGTGGMNALICKETGTFIGLCGLLVQHVNGRQELEIGYSILPRFWGMGYASEAAQKCKEVAFNKKWACRLISIIQINNVPSQKVALKNGMKIDKTTTYKQNPVHIYCINK